MIFLELVFLGKDHEKFRQIAIKFAKHVAKTYYLMAVNAGSEGRNDRKSVPISVFSRH